MSLLTMGVAYEKKALYPEAVECHLKALRITEGLNMVDLTRKGYSDIGIVYSDMDDYPRALDYLHRALKLVLKEGNQIGLASAYINLGDAFNHSKQYDSAITYNALAAQISRKIQDSGTLSVSLLNLGENYTQKNQPQKAIDYLQRALRISEIGHDEEGIAWAHNDLAVVYDQLKQYDQSIAHAEIGLQKSEAMHINESVKESCHALYTDYLGKGDYKKALFYRNREIDLQDSLFNLEKEQRIKGLQSDYELERKQHQIDLLNKDKVIQQDNLVKERIRQYILLCGTALLGLWAFLLARSNAQRKRLNLLLESRNREIVTQNEQLEDLNRIKNKLLSIIGHDLRSPIGTLQGFVDLLKSSSLSTEQIHYFSAKMSESLKGTSHLLDNLLFWAKSQMEGMQVNVRPFDLRPIIWQNRDLAQGRADEKQIILDTPEMPDPIIAHADRMMIDMIIRNLVENALKFSRQGDVVSIFAEIRPEHIDVVVRDTGIGIPLEDQSKILNNSVSYTTPGTSSEKGSGLGLSMCKELIEKNGGAIRFTSHPGKGTSFIFSLPKGNGE